MRGRPREFDEKLALHKAMRVFWTKGFHAASLQELVTAMGIGKQSLYATYGDKESLYHKALRYAAESQTSELVLLLRGPGTAQERMEAIFELWSDSSTTAGSAGCIFGNGLAASGHLDPAVAEMCDRALAMLEEGIAHCLAELVDDPRDKARLILTLSQGIFIMARRPGSRPLVVAAIAHMRQLAGLAVKDGTMM